MKAFREEALLLDREDILASFREQFLIPETNSNPAIYFLGNSLGLQPRSTADRISKVLHQWQHLGVEGFFKGEDPWLQLHSKITPSLARIAGAKPTEIVVMNQLTVNLHLLLVSFYRPQGNRIKILCEAKAFPSDQYLLESHLISRGLDPKECIIEVAPREDESLIRHEDILQAINTIGEELALVFLGGVNYYSGQLFHMADITKQAHGVGAMCGFDLAHAIGNVELQLHQWNVDFAAWCSYKYLNSGPGAIAGAFIHERYHSDDKLMRFAGWWGYRNSDRFLMRKGFVPEAGAEGWQLSTPSIILYACHLAALEIFDLVPLEALFQKGKQLSDYLLRLLNTINETHGGNYLRVITPDDNTQRGCQISIELFAGARRVFDRLTEKGVFADWREPGIIRVAPVPLYNSFEEVWNFARILEESID